MKAIWEKIKKFDWYRMALLLGIPISTAILAYLLGSGSGDLLLADPVLDIITIPAFIGSFLSGTTYIARLLDAYFPNRQNNQATQKKIATPQATTKPPKRRIGPRERRGTVIGLIAGLIVVGVTIGCQVSVPFLAPLSGFAYVLFSIGVISTFAGLGNRLGNSLDDKSTRQWNERIAIGIAAILGLTAGITIAALSISTAVSVVGVTTFVTGGAALPVGIAGIVFTLAMAGTTVAFADYSMKAINFVKYTWLTRSGANQVSNYANLKFQKTIGQRYHEYRGSLVGVSAGLVVGGVIITALLLTQPYLFAGAAIAGVAGVLITMTTTAILGGLSSRIGRLVDGFEAKKNVTEKSFEKTALPEKLAKLSLDPKPTEKQIKSTPGNGDAKKPALTTTATSALPKHTDSSQATNPYRLLSNPRPTNPKPTATPSATLNVANDPSITYSHQRRMSAG